MGKISNKFKGMLLAFAMTIGVAVGIASNKSVYPVRAETDTFAFSSTYQGQSGSGENKTFTWSNAVLTVTQRGNGATVPNNSYTTAPRWYGTANDQNLCTFTPASGITITQMVFTVTQGSFASGIWSDGTINTNTWTGSQSSAFTFRPTAQVRPTTIAITYSTGGGSGSSSSSSSSSSAAPVTYTISYDSNGGTGTITDANSPYESGASVTVKDSTGFTAPYSDMVFDKWNTAANGSGQDYNPGDPLTITADTTLYAQWKDDPNISYATVYSTGFESTEDFTAGSNYMTTITSGPEGKQWETFYGTPSTNSKIVGSQSLQMRWYYNHAEDYPHTETKFVSHEVKRVTFKYKAGNSNLDFKVQYNTDGGNSWTDIETINTVDNNVHDYRKVFPSAISSFYLRILVCLGTAPTSGNYALIIDSVVFNSDSTLASINGDNEVYVGTQWAPTSVTENVSGNTVTGATFAFAASNNAVISASNPSTGAFTASAAGTVTVSATKAGYLIASKNVTVNPIDSSIVVAKASTTGYTGQNETIEFTYMNIIDTVVVESNNTSVVTISSLSCSAGSGTVQFNFVGVGSTTVLFKDGDLELDSVSVEVSLSQVTITGLPAAKELFVGRMLDLGSVVTVTAVGSCSNTVTWESDDDNVVMVDDSGVILGAATGTANVTVSSNDYPSASMTCAVTVNEAPQNAYIIDFGLAKNASSTTLSTDSGFKTAYSFDDDEEVTFSGFDKIYGETNKMLKLGSNKNTATLTITIPSYSYISSVEMVVGETPDGIDLNIASGAAEAQTESQTLAVGKLTFDDYLESEKSNSITLSSSAAGAFYLENLIIHYVSAVNEVRQLNTQTKLSYHYSDDGNGGFSYSNISIRFGAVISKEVWNRLNNYGTGINGFGVMITSINVIHEYENIADYANDAVSAESSPNINSELVDHYMEIGDGEGQMETPPESGNNYIWNLFQSIDYADRESTYIAAAYVKVNNEYLFLGQKYFSVISIALDYLANRGCNGETADGSLSYLSLQTSME